MHSFNKGYVVLKDFLRLDELRSATEFASHDEILNRYFSDDANFRPQFTLDHYTLIKNKEDSLLNKFRPFETPLTRASIAKLLKKKKKAPKMEDSLLRMAQEVTQKLHEKSTPEEFLRQQYAEISREKISGKASNVWMNEPDNMLRVYRSMMDYVGRNAEVKLPSPLRLAGDQLVQRWQFAQAEGYNFCLSYFPCHQSWDTLLSEIDTESHENDVSLWSSIVVWIFHTPMTENQGGIHFLKNSHRKLCEHCKQHAFDGSKVSHHEFLPMKGHVKENVRRFKLDNLEVDSYMSFDAGTVVLMHPATAYAMSVNMSRSRVSSQQIYLMKDGAQGPFSPHTDESWYGRWARNKQMAVLNDPNLFPMITGGV